MNKTRVVVSLPKSTSKLPVSFKNYLKKVIKFSSNIVYSKENLKYVKVESADLIWDPFSGHRKTLAYGLFTDVPIIVTLHGLEKILLTPKKFGIKDNHKKISYYIDRLKLKAKIHLIDNVSRKIIVPSRYMKKELKQRFSIRSGVSIHHGVDHEVYSNKNEEREYILHVSQYSPKKNIERIVNAYHMLNNEIKDKYPLRLHCAGYPYQINTQNVKLTTNILGAQKISELYNKAKLFLFPSTHESFGMPIVEAMSCGTPVITSTLSSCPEIVGDSGITVNPYSADAICSAMSRILRDEQEWSKLQKKALSRAEEFSWTRSAYAHSKLFRSIL